MRPRRHKPLSWIWVAIAGAVALFFLFDLWPSADIRFLLPPEFHGGFIIIEDSVGVDLGGRFVGQYVVAVPSSRVVKVKSFAPFEPWHTESIQIGENGPILAVVLDPAEDVVALRCGGTGSRTVNGVAYRERMDYFWGTAEEYSKFDPYSIPTDAP